MNVSSICIRIHRIVILSALCLFASACASRSNIQIPSNPLAGTWTLVAADAIQADGTRVPDYGRAPKGLLLVDAAGHYSLQIFEAERPHFSSGNKGSATPTEYKAAVLGSSTHFGYLTVDVAARTLNFSISASSFPNWEGTTQARHFELENGVLSYQVPSRPDGTVPVSVWKRVEGGAGKAPFTEE